MNRFLRFNGIFVFILLLILFLSNFNLSVYATDSPDINNLRRPISSDQPLWLIHIDTWNWADPQKIIDLIPEDILPYVVFNISLSINWDPEQKEWLVVEYGYETAKSWLRTCAENQVWAMIQPSSGGQSHFPDYDETKDYADTLYDEFFRDYPNFLGFNYCEQFWGFDQEDFPVTFAERWVHFANLVNLSNKYGGYLVVSFTGGHWGAALNPLAMVKTHPYLESTLRQYPQNFIICEKFTMDYGFHDIESVSLGMFLSGYAGNWGIRFDQSGWKPHPSQPEEEFPVAAGIAPVIEHVMLTGQTVIDGPELIWLQCFRELSQAQTTDGYIERRWGVYPQFENISIDIFRKIIDGSIPILNRKEVIERTKIVMINDVKFGQQWDKYGSPQFFLKDLYYMDDDGTNLEQNSWFKKTGRYPTIPTVYQLVDSLAQSFELQVSQNNYLEMANAKKELDTLFPQEYTGDIYAGRQGNSWVTYNPYKTGESAGGKFSFKYNTCDSMEVTYSPYTTAVINEYPDKINLYINNYDNTKNELQSNEIKIYGSTSKPEWSYQDRGTNQLPSYITTSWVNGVFTMLIKHNGPVDIVINCVGTESDRFKYSPRVTVVPPKRPPVYTGPRQYEAEHFEYRNIGELVSNGIRRGVSNYTGQGYMRFGKNPNAKARVHVQALADNKYILEIKYSVAEANVDTVDLFVNGVKIATPLFAKTASSSDWAILKQEISLNEGRNSIEFKANSRGAGEIYFDHILIDQSF